MSKKNWREGRILKREITIFSFRFSFWQLLKYPVPIRETFWHKSREKQSIFRYGILILNLLMVHKLTYLKFKKYMSPLISFNVKQVCFAMLKNFLRRWLNFEFSVKYMYYTSELHDMIL